MCLAARSLYTFSAFPSKQCNVYYEFHQLLVQGGGKRKQTCRKLCSGTVAWLCVQSTAHRRLKCAVFAALQTTGRRTLLDTGMDPWRKHCSALALFAMLTSLLVGFFFLSLELLMLDCCNWLQLWELILVHKFHSGSLPNVCVSWRKNNCTGFGVGCACLPFSNQRSAANPWADLGLYKGSVCS